MKHLGLGIVSYFQTHNFLVALFILIGLLGIAMMIVFSNLDFGGDIGFFSSFTIGGSFTSGPDCIQTYIGIN